MKLYDVKIADTFKIAGIEFIKFSQDGDRVVAVAKDTLFNSTFGDNNDFSKSTVLKRLENEILPKIENEVGAENVLEFETDLLSLDGSNIYGTLKSKVSLPTFDFYRQNVKVFDKYKINDWWWLATPDSTKEHANDYWTVCVSPSGFINGINCGNDYGVRPFFTFLSSILVSCED